MCITKMQLLKSVKVDDVCYSIDLMDEETIYAGLRGGVDLIKQDTNTLHIMSFDATVNCLRFYGEIVYLLLFESKLRRWLIKSHVIEDAATRRQKEHEDAVCLINSFAIVDDIIYVPSRSRKCIAKYTVALEPAAGEIKISLSASTTCMCSTPTGYLVLTQEEPSRAICINPETAAPLWCVDDLKAPLGVFVDRYNYLLVATGGEGRKLTIETRNLDTGKFQLSYM